MAKVRFTDRGNIRVIMDTYQYEIMMQIINHVRLGDRNTYTTAISDLAADLEPFNTEHGFGDDPEKYVKVSVNRERPDGSLREVKEFVIELTDVQDNDDEEDDE